MSHLSDEEKMVLLRGDLIEHATWPDSYYMLFRIIDGLKARIKELESVPSAAPAPTEPPEPVTAKTLVPKSAIATFHNTQALTWIQQSNRIEDVHSQIEDDISLRAWRWLKAKPDLSLPVILKLHGRIMKEQLSKAHLGAWRTCGVRVGPRLCPHHEEVPALMASWFTYHCNVQTESAIKRAHVRFEEIHPFVDGNGRTGRMIMNYQRMRAGFPPLTIWADERQKYYEWFHGVGSR